jgi:hypothetical protein
VRLLASECVSECARSPPPAQVLTVELMASLIAC